MVQLTFLYIPNDASNYDCDVIIVALPFMSFPQQNNARVIADSILALREERLISDPSDDPHITSELRKQGTALTGGEGSEEDGATPQSS